MMQPLSLRKYQLGISNALWSRVLLFLLLLHAIFYASFKLSLYMSFASTAYFMMVSGIIFVKAGRLHDHISSMKTAMVIDLAIVLGLEFSRSVVHTAITNPLSSIQIIHIGSSTLAVFLYLPAYLLGRKRLKAPEPKITRLHQKIGLVAFAARTMGFLMMFLHHIKH